MWLNPLSEPAGHALPLPELNHLNVLMAKTEISFHWRNANLKDAILAISYAVSLGYDTRELLQQALPQFSKNRLLLALDLLFSSGMASVNLGVLSVSNDIKIIDQMVETKIQLPIAEEEITPPVKRKIALSLGLSNPAGIDVLLFTRTKEISNAA